MKSIDQRILSLYCDAILGDAENFDPEALKEVTAKIPFTERDQDRLVDVFKENYYQWSLDAFTIGLHLGLSLCGALHHLCPEQT